MHRWSSVRPVSAAEGVHYVPRYTLIRETLDWFDRYLGPVKGH